MRLTTTLPCLVVALCWAVTLGSPAHGQPSAAEVDRELVVRFTRAYGMAKEAFQEHTQNEAPSGKTRDAMLRQPDELDGSLRREVNRILDLNGLQKDEWEMMFARMEADEDLRRRVESLSTPFQ